MMMTGEEVGRFHALLIVHYNQPDLTVLLGTRLGKDFEKLVSSGAKFNLAVMEVIVTAGQQGWQKDLVEAVVSDRPMVPEIRTFYLQYRADRPAPSADPYEVVELRRGQVFVNRKDLRSALRSLNSANGERILVIDGPSGSGKTYSSRLIQYLAEGSGGYQAIHIDLERLQRPRPFDVAHALISKMAGDLAAIPQQSLESDPRWVMLLADVIQREARKLGGTRWVVFDGFARAQVPADTRDLILELARRAEEDFRELRVILLGFSDLPGFADSLPVEVFGTARREKLGEISPADCVQCVQRVRKDLGLKDDNDAELGSAVRRIFAAAEGQGVKRLASIASGVRQLLDELRS